MAASKPSGVLFGLLPPAGFVVMVWPPVPCGCGRTAAMLVNRDGKTCCIECDSKKEGSR